MIYVCTRTRVKPQAVHELSPVAADTAPLRPSQNVSKTDDTSVVRVKWSKDIQ